MTCWYIQIPGVDFSGNYLPVVYGITYRLLLVLKIMYGFSAKIDDVETAFLRGDLEEEIFIDCPKGLKRMCLFCTRFCRQVFVYFWVFGRVLHFFCWSIRVFIAPIFSVFFVCAFLWCYIFWTCSDFCISLFVGNSDDKYHFANFRCVFCCIDISRFYTILFFILFCSIVFYLFWWILVHCNFV